MSGTSSLTKALIGGRGYEPKLVNTLLTGGLGAGTTVGYSALTDDKKDRTLGSKIMRYGVDAATGAGMAITGHDRFGLAGGLTGTGLGIGSRKLQDVAGDYAEKHLDSPYGRAAVDAGLSASIGSMAGTMVTTSLLRGGGLRSLGMKLMKRMGGDVDSTTSPAKAFLSELGNLATKQEVYEKALNRLTLKGYSLDDVKAAVSKVQHKLHPDTQQYLDKAVAKYNPNKSWQGNPVEHGFSGLELDASGKFVSNPKMQEAASDYDEYLRFNRDSYKPGEITPKDQEILSMLGDVPGYRAHKLLSQTDHVGSAFDSLLGKPGSTGFSISNMLKDSLKGDKSIASKASKMQYTHAQDVQKELKKEFYNRSVAPYLKRESDIVDEWNKLITPIRPERTISKQLAENSDKYVSRPYVPWARNMTPEVEARLKALSEEYSGMLDTVYDKQLRGGGQAQSDLASKLSKRRALEQAKREYPDDYEKYRAFLEDAEEMSPADRLTAFAPNKGGMGMLAKLLDNYSGSPATTELLRKYKTIQNIPGMEYLKAQIVEDILHGSLAGLAFTPITAGPAFYDAYKQNNKSYIDKFKDRFNIKPWA